MVAGAVVPVGDIDLVAAAVVDAQVVVAAGEADAGGWYADVEDDAVDNPGVVVVVTEGVITAKARLVSSARPLWSGLSVKG